MPYRLISSIPLTSAALISTECVFRNPHSFFIKIYGYSHTSLFWQPLGAVNAAQVGHH
jgi:hypothetical protein